MKIKYLIAIVVLAALHFSCVWGGVDKKFGGFVYDDLTKEPIVGAEVNDIRSGDDVLTDDKGYFIIKLEVPADDHSTGRTFSITKDGYSFTSLFIIYDSLDEVCYLTPSERYIVNGQVVDSSTDVGITSKLRINFVPEESDGYIGLSKSIDLTTDVNGNFELDFYYPEYYESVNIDVTSDGYISKNTDNYTFSEEYVSSDDTIDGYMSIHVRNYDFGTIKLNRE